MTMATFSGIFYFIAVFAILSSSLRLVPTATSDLASDRAALVALRSAVGGRSLLWNLSDATPCSWSGVTCSADRSRVVELHFPGMGFTGTIPPNSISNLTALTTLSLRYNALSGNLPSDLFVSLSDLRNIYLQHNLFSGPIPDSIYSLPNLVRLNLANNNFSGPLSASLNNLTRLGTLYLENNQFSGQLPELNLSSVVQLNLSNNQLSGSIPQGLSRKPKDAFLGNSLCGAPLDDLCNGQSNNGGNGKKHKLSGGAIAGIVIGCIVGLLAIILILLCLCRRRGEKDVRSKGEVGVKQTEIEIHPEKSAESEEKDGGFASVAAEKKEKGKASDLIVGQGQKSLVFFSHGGGKGYDLDDLLKASAEVLGKGTFGTAYKAGLESGLTVVVKRLRDVTFPEKEFREKIEAVGKMNHENLVPLRAYYYTKEEKLLVYDYVPMGSLSALLHGNKGGGRTPLNWDTRTKIALGAAHAIAYLHSQGSTVSHGNIKSSNVLLTKLYDARVSDFGLAELVGNSPNPNRVAGYRAPEVTDPRKVSQKADVYSFGVLLLELLTGKAPTNSISNDDGVDLPRWVQSIVKEEWTSEVFDLELLRYQNVEEDMVQLLQLAVDCTAQYPDKRPSMAEVATRIEELCKSSLLDSQDEITTDSKEQPPILS